MDLVSRLAENGTRSRGSSGHASAQPLLIEAMARAGLDNAHGMPAMGSGHWQHLIGTLQGRSANEIIVSAHYDTVEASRGVLDNASGCAATLGAASELSRVPLHNTVRFLLSDGEESGAAGSREWLSERSTQHGAKVLANLNVDMVGSRLQSGPGIVHIVAGWDQDRRVVSPAWLVHAVLKGAEVSNLPVAVLDSRWSWLAQLAVRCALPVRVSDGRSFLEAGIPSVTLSDLQFTAGGSHHPDIDEDRHAVDASRLQSWTQTLAATSRRLDGLQDRPTDDTEYLVLGGRVWIRRDLVWVGFVLWILQVWRGLPGSWRRRDSAARRRLGRSYLPGFAFRMLFLVAVFLIPVFSTILLYPVGVLALLGTAVRVESRLPFCLLAVAPTLFFVLWLIFGQWAGWLTLDRAALLPATLVLLNLATFCAWQSDTSPDPR